MELQEFASITELQEELAKVLRQAAKERQQKVDLESIIRKSAYAAFTALGPVPTEVVKPASSGHGTPETAVVMAADWQFGKVTPDYNKDVAEARIELFVEKTRRLVDVQRAEHPIDHAEVWLLGDLVEGERIFPGQEYHIDSSLIDQVVGQGGRVLRNFLTGMISIFDTVLVRAVPGNHGRIGGLRSNVYHPDTNMDRMMYMIAEQWFEATGEIEAGRITFEIPRGRQVQDGSRELDNELWGEALISTIGNYKTLLIHGQQLAGKGAGGGMAELPYPSFSKKVLRWRDLALAGHIASFDDVAVGHWHTHADIPVGSSTLRVAGSPESYNVWSQKELGRGGSPSQRIMFVHPDRGVTAEYKVYLDQ